MKFVICDGKAYSDDEWRLMEKMKKEEERMKDSKYTKFLESSKVLEEAQREKLRILAQFACDNKYAKIFTYLEIIVLRAQLIPMNENLIDGLVELVKKQEVHSIFSSENIQKIFSEAILHKKDQKISKKAIENVVWFYFRGEKEEQLIKRLF